MSGPTAIGMVSESLRALLLGEMSLTPTVPVTILAPDEPGGSRRVNLFLYKVMENVALRNMDWQVSPSDTTRLVPPPLSLNLFYLMTAYAQNDAQSGNATAHALLGDAMRVFHEHPVIPASFLAPGLLEAREQVRIIHSPNDLEELGRIWATFTQPFRLSVLYQITVVQIDALPAAQRPVPQRVRRIGVPSVRAPFAPPEIRALTPLAGPAGATVTFHGRNLDGWRATVLVAGALVLDGQPVSGDSFIMALPAGLDPGFYEVRVDISNLFRTTLFFEVTP